MFVLADVSYSLATSVLTQAVSLPIATCGPQIVSNAWGTFVYKEIRGIRNFVFLFSGFLVAIVASILIGLSV
jgi:hypothetical protein